jgi:hypothetical protein
MSAPPLPDIFGNYALGDFVEVTPPADVAWWPQTAGWAWVGGLLALWLTRKLWLRARHWYRNRYRREALAKLAALEQVPANAQTAREVNHLLKLTALCAWSRESVASLTGGDWTEFLNGSCEAPPFDVELAKLLATGPYTAPDIDAATGSRLLSASRRWIAEHRGPADV